MGARVVQRVIGFLASALVRKRSQALRVCWEGELRVTDMSGRIQMTEDAAHLVSKPCPRHHCAAHLSSRTIVRCI